MISEKFFKNATRFKKDTKIKITPKNRFQIRVEQQNKCKVTQIFAEVEKITFNLTEKEFVKLLTTAVQKHNESIALPKFKKRKEAIYDAKNKEAKCTQRTLYGLKMKDIKSFSGELPICLYEAKDDE